MENRPMDSPDSPSKNDGLRVEVGEKMVNFHEFSPKDWWLIAAGELKHPRI